MSKPGAQGFSLASLLRQQWLMLALALLLGTAALIGALALLAYSGHFITATALAGLAATAPLFEIFRPGAIIRFLALLRTVGRYGERVLAHDAVLGLMAQLRGELYARLAQLAPQPLARWSDGDLLQRVVADVDLLTQAPLRAALPVAGAALVLLAAVLFLLQVDARAGAFAAACLLVAALVVPALVARRSLADGRNLVARYAQRRGQLVDALRGLTTLLLCGAWTQRRADWQHEDRAVIRAELAQRLRESAGICLVVFLAGLAAWLILRLAQPVSPAQTQLLAAAVLGAIATLEALAPVSGALLAWGRARAAAGRIDALLQQLPAVSYPSIAVLPTAAGGVELRAVDFHYPGRRGGVSNLTLGIAPGARVVVSGPSGAGKSTLAALLGRLMDPDAGVIELDGVDLRAYDEAALRQRVALQEQRPHLFAASLADNLRVADASADHARLRAVLQAVALEDFLHGLPQGLDTPIGEYGLGLSGGEARRVALARTLLRPAALFVLDEPFEGLDAATRSRVIAGLGQWIGSATLIVISHQPVEFAVPATQLRLQPA